MAPLLMQTLGLSGVSLLGSSFPLLLARHQRVPCWLMPLATGIMSGLCLFGLLPELLHEGGQMSLGIAAAIALLYSCVHLLHLWQHAGHDHDHSLNPTQACSTSQGAASKQKPMFLLFASIFVHSLFDGALLVISRDWESATVFTLLVSLGVHKFFEAMSITSILIGRRGSVVGALPWVAAYSLSFALGVSLVSGAQEFIPAQFLKPCIFIIMAVAIGNLTSCLFFDFILPSLRRFRDDRREVAWLIAGLTAAGLLIVKL